jgi:gliding motility-associated-like protein
MMIIQTIVRVLKKTIFLVLLLFLNAGTLFATHQKAAEITYRHLHGTTYEFTLITYTYLLSLADRPVLEIVWRTSGGSPQRIEVLREHPPTDYDADLTRENHYIFPITFPGDGTYFVSMEDPNRNENVQNLPNSVNTPMYTETMIFVSSAMGPNSSPILLNKPTDNGCYGVLFMHNPGAFDPDGDSLSYRLINCRGADGLDVPGYRLPSARNSIGIDAVAGDLIWDFPEGIGEFNFAILIEKYRRGIRIGSITRDMQVNIQVCDNNPPELHVPERVCVFAGDTLRVPIMATDLDEDDILTLSATSGIFPNNVMNFPPPRKSPLYDTLVWIPQHAHVQNNPYPVYFRVKDNGIPNLNTLKTMFIQVVGKAPQWDSIVPTFEAISLHWTPILNENIFGYRIFRAQTESGITQNSCDFGFNDAYYQMVVQLNDHTISKFTDFNVDQNFLYCYRIVAVYKNGTESQMSEERCMTKLSNTPILEKVSVVETAEIRGKIELAWRRPLDIDIASSGTNFRYAIHRWIGDGFQEIHTVDDIFDTTYLDDGVLVNTEKFPYTYKIELKQMQDELLESIGFSNEATSIFANATGRNRRVNLQWEVFQPWKTERFEIYRKEKYQDTFALIANVTSSPFSDTAVINDSTYTYKIKAFGRHYNTRINDYVLINWSQETTATPAIDTPQIEILMVTPFCKPLENHLEWWPTEEWMYDFLNYQVFFSSSKTGTFRRIDESRHFWSIGENMFIHKNTFVGCYYVVATNSRGYQSDPSDTICISPQQYRDMCMNYRLPNVFTPNDDGINDEFKAFPHDYSGAFTIKIFNRWGNLVFESNNPDFEWDGRHHNTKQAVPEGVYFYVVELGGLGGENLTQQTISGSVTLLR